MKGVMLVRSGPSSPDREDEYNDWYSNTHLPDVLQVPGIVGATRYRLHGEGDGSGGPSYLAVYELDTDDLDAPIAELGARFADGRLPLSDAMAMDPPPAVTIYERL